MARLLFAGIVMIALASSTAAVSLNSLPASFVLLPLSSFTDESLVAAYNCDAVLGYHSCSGHGQCNLLLDSDANYSQSFINASTAVPVPASDTLLDGHGIDVDTPLPAAVCVCDNGWIGRGDYINHYALDGDSCGMNQSAVLALSSIGIVEFAFVLVLALHRLYRWYVWHDASLADSDTAGLTLAVDVESYHSSEKDKNSSTDCKHTQAMPSPITHHHPSASGRLVDTPLTPLSHNVEAAIRAMQPFAANKNYRTSSRAVDAGATPSTPTPIGITTTIRPDTPVSYTHSPYVATTTTTTQPATPTTHTATMQHSAATPTHTYMHWPAVAAVLGTPSALSRSVRGHQRTNTIGGGIKLPIRVSNEAAITAVIVKTRAQKRQLLYRHMQHITFLYPALSVGVALVSIVFFGARIGTDWTVGNSYQMSLLIYVQNALYLLAGSVAVLNTLRVASAVTRTKTGVKGLTNVNHWAKRCLIGLLCCASITELLVFLDTTYNTHQQLMAQLNLCLAFTPITAMGVVSIVATRRITHSLVQHLDMLSPQQKQDRLDTYTKLRRQAMLLSVLCVFVSFLSFFLAAEPYVRQQGLPYFALVMHYTIALTLTTRLFLLRSTTPQRQTIAPAPAAITATSVMPSPMPLHRVLTASSEDSSARLKASSMGSRTGSTAGSGATGSGGGGAGGGDGDEVVMVVRSPSTWGRTMSAKGVGGIGVVLGYEQSSHARASSEHLPA